MNPIPELGSLPCDVCGGRVAFAYLRWCPVCAAFAEGFAPRALRHKLGDAMQCGDREAADKWTRILVWRMRLERKPGGGTTA
jgi:hypothetical protein